MTMKSHITITETRQRLEIKLTLNLFSLPQLKLVYAVLLLVFVSKTSYMYLSLNSLNEMKRVGLPPNKLIKSEA